jgi:dihydrofolate synthase/folylpolyglutamate synthase
MGNPQDKLNYIHVAGTNGKGSTSSFLSNILIEQGLKVGLYSSPFLEVFNERIRLNGNNISNNDLASITAYVKRNVDKMLVEGYDHPTEFEIVTAIAFEYYLRQNADIVVLEVGMGGRLDSTNVVKTPFASVITPIEFDHMEYLGDDISKIAFEKAGIIKKDSPVIFHPQMKGAKDVILNIANENSSNVFTFDEEDIKILNMSIDGTVFSYKDEIYEISLLGEHQTRNATTAIITIDALNKLNKLSIDKEIVKKGIKKTTWPGRLEILSVDPYLVIDGAHNLHGARGLSKSIKTYFNGKRIVGVLGILEDKDVNGILDETIPLFDEVIVTEPNSPRKMKYYDLMKKIELYGKPVEGYESINHAILEAKHRLKKDDVAIFYGSLYLIGEVRSMLSERNSTNEQE